MKNRIVAEVVESKNTALKTGDFVAGLLNWSEFQTSNGTGLIKVDANAAPLSAYQGILGMPGLTAYLGLLEIGGEAMPQLTKWFHEGKLINKETIVEGFENIPQAFFGLFEETNTGKMIVKV